MYYIRPDSDSGSLPAVSILWRGIPYDKGKGKAYKVREVLNLPFGCMENEILV